MDTIVDLWLPKHGIVLWEMIVSYGISIHIYIYIFSTMVLWQVYGTVMAFLMGIYSGSTVLFSMGMIRDYG